MKWDIGRLKEALNQINGIDEQPEEGMNRLALSDKDMQGRELFKEKCGALGLEIREDAMGNIWARKEGTEAGLPAILCGSHMDTVPNGGKYDGLLGVLTALEAVQIMIEQKVQHAHSIELVVFSIEESSRFNLSTVGSKALVGEISKSQLKNAIAQDGISLYEALSDRGYAPDDLEDCILNPEQYEAFVELHIEQGPVLEREAVDIGVVEAIAAPMRFQLNLLGEEAHSGACPMYMRRDALNAAAEIILEIEKKGIEESMHKTVTTTGICRVYPGAMNVVPGEVDLYVDIRGISLESMMRTLGDIVERVEDICRKRNIQQMMKVISQDRPVLLDERMIEHILKNCHKLGLSCKQMPSGAGHDAMNMAKILPTALIFIPCKDGISHNKKEAVADKDLENGLKLLYETLVSLSQGSLIKE
ncbi:MAG: Zn-dependent hydrolase [Thermotaleaceae bacterium]